MVYMGADAIEHEQPDLVRQSQTVTWNNTRTRGSRACAGRRECNCRAQARSMAAGRATFGVAAALAPRRRYGVCDLFACASRFPVRLPHPLGLTPGGGARTNLQPCRLLFVVSTFRFFLLLGASGCIQVWLYCCLLGLSVCHLCAGRSGRCLGAPARA